jgi:hypothetical protein
MALNCDLPELCLLSSWDYRHEHQCWAQMWLFPPSFFDLQLANDRDL